MTDHDLDLMCEVLNIPKKLIREGVEYTLNDIVKDDNDNIELIYYAAAQIHAIAIKGVFTSEDS